MNILEKQDINTKLKDKLPFAVFVCPQNNNGVEDYKKLFTKIVSDRL